MMKYTHYKEEDFIKDEYFQKWILNPDDMTKNFWENWIISNPEKREAIKEAERFVQLMDFNVEELSDADFNAMWQAIIQRRKGVEHKIYRLDRSNSVKRNHFRQIAAIFVGLIGITALFYLTRGKDNQNTMITDAPRITLELEDGTIKVLDDTASETITNADGRQVVNQKQNTLVYNTKNSKTSQNISYNQLFVPYGKKFELILSDGTHIFLNSGSKLRYPVVFLKGKPRDVYLDGEAYFSVERDTTRPFTVITDDYEYQRVRYGIQCIQL